MAIHSDSPWRLRRLSFDRPAWPFDPRRVPVYYGWVVVVVATVGMLCSTPGQTIGVSVFTDDLMAATGLTRVQISLTYLAGTLGGALFLPRAGRIYDRLGARTMTSVTAVAFGAVLLLLSQLDAIIALLHRALGTPDLAVPLSLGVMSAGFFALRFLGQGVLTMGSRNMAMKWFERRRGLAIGIMGLMASLGFSGAPIFFDALIEGYGWHGAWRILGLAVGLGLTAVVVLFYRDNPEECGLRPDGGVAPARGSRPADAASFTLAQARRTPAFWIFLLPMGLAGLYGTALPFHVVSIFAEAGLPRDAAIRLFLPAAVVAVAVNLVGAWVSDRTSLRWHLGLFQLGMILSNLGLLHLDQPWGSRAIIAGTGIMGGMMRLLSSLTWPRYYGRRHLGAITGFVMAWTVAASAVGPTVFGYSLEVFGSYHPASTSCITLLVLSTCMVPWARRPPP